MLFPSVAWGMFPPFPACRPSAAQPPRSLVPLPRDNPKATRLLPSLLHAAFIILLTFHFETSSHLQRSFKNSTVSIFASPSVTSYITASPEVSVDTRLADLHADLPTCRSTRSSLGVQSLVPELHHAVLSHAGTAPAVLTSTPPVSVAWVLGFMRSQPPSQSQLLFSTVCSLGFTRTFVNQQCLGLQPVHRAIPQV